MTSWWVQQISDGNYVPKYHGSIGCLVPVVNVKILEKCPNSHQIAKLNDTLVSFSSFLLKKSKSLDINATNQLTPFYSARHVSINRPGGGGAKNFYVAQKASDSKWCWHTLVPKNRHSLRKKNISRVGGRSNALPQFYVGGRVRIKVLSKRKLWVLWSVFSGYAKRELLQQF